MPDATFIGGLACIISMGGIVVGALLFGLILALADRSDAGREH